MRIESNLVEIDGTMTIMTVEGRSFDNWLEREYRVAYAIAWKIVQDDVAAHDAVTSGAGSFLRTYDFTKGPPRPWFHTKVRFAALDIVEDRACAPDQLDPNAVEPVPDPSAVSDFETSIKQINFERKPRNIRTAIAMSELKERRPTDHFIVTLRVRDELDWSAISDRLNKEKNIDMIPDTARVRCERACGYVRRRVEEGKPIPLERDAKSDTKGDQE